MKLKVGEQSWEGCEYLWPDGFVAFPGGPKAADGGPAQKFSCNVCNVKLNSEFQKNEHMKGKSHKDRVAESKQASGPGGKSAQGAGPGNKFQNATGGKQGKHIDC